MKKRIVFTGGGTLGHVMPNLYLIDDLKSKNIDISYVGSSGIEANMVRASKVDFIEIPAVKLVRGKILKNLKIPFVLVGAVFKARKVLKSNRPNLIFSKGGYVSLPVCIAARMLKIPIMAHESDYTFGLANKLILKLCSKMCVNFEHLEKTNKKIIYTGPIFSKEFDSKERSDLAIDISKPTLLIVGGSLGSKKINELIYAVLRDLMARYNVIQITGKGNKKFDSFDNYFAYESTDKMVRLYNMADFVIGRSGAGVSAECFYKKIPMLLIPLEKATRGDQLQNAKYYENLGVAKILHEEALTPTNLLNEISIFYNNIAQYRARYQNIKHTNGKTKVLELINNYINE